MGFEHYYRKPEGAFSYYEGLGLGQESQAQPVQVIQPLSTQIWQYIKSPLGLIAVLAVGFVWMKSRGYLKNL
jgi:hypothetical protein